MIGLVFDKNSKKVIAKVDNVQNISSTEVIGQDGSVKGIDISIADFVIVDTSELVEGDLIDTSQLIDVRNSLPPNPDDRITALENAIIALTSV